MINDRLLTCDSYFSHGFMGGVWCGWVGEVREGTTSPNPDHKFEHSLDKWDNCVIRV